MAIIRLLLSLASSLNRYLHQLNSNITFLHGDINEEVYMKLSYGLNVSNKNLVWKHTKFLYGHKKVGKQWNQKLTSTLFELGFHQPKSDYTLFTKKSTNYFTDVLVYVDDLFL